MLGPRTEFCSLPASDWFLLLFLVEGKQEDTSLCLVPFLPPWALNINASLRLLFFPKKKKKHLEAPLLEMAEAKVTELSTK